MSFTAEELEAVAQEAYEKTGETGDFFMDAYYEEISELETSLGKIVVEHVDGGEGDGAPIEVVISINGRYFEQDGYYSSWGESAMDGDLYEVKPKQVQVTQYERV